MNEQSLDNKLRNLLLDSLRREYSAADSAEQEVQMELPGEQAKEENNQ